MCDDIRNLNDHGEQTAGEDFAATLRTAIARFLGDSFTTAGGRVRTETITGFWVTVILTLPPNGIDAATTRLISELSAYLAQMKSFDCRLQGEEGQLRWWVLKQKVPGIRTRSVTRENQPLPQ